MKTIAIITLALLLGACATPPRAVPPELVRVLPPASLTETEPAPIAPDPDASTQRDVARYLLDLSEWGERATARVKEIRQWAEGKTTPK